VQFRFDGIAPFNPFSLHLAMPMLEWGLNWAVATHSNQFLIIHSAALERDGLTLVLVGAPGAGKSTLTAGLCRKGWRLFSDELTLVRPRDGRIVPLPRPIGLKNESIAIMREFAPDAVISPSWTDTHKGTVAHMRPPQESVSRANQTAAPGWIFFLSFKPNAPLSLLPISKSQAFLRVAQNSFNYSLLGAKGFETTANMIDSSDCYEFSYGDLRDATARLAELRPPD
jgi:HprK-related kinase A